MQQVIARNRQVREIFADLDINEDSLYVFYCDLI